MTAELLLATLAFAAEPGLAAASETGPDPVLVSLSSGTLLGSGGSAAQLAVGFPGLRAEWMQGMSGVWDAGGTVRIDYVSSEMLLAGTGRFRLGEWGRFSAAARAHAGLYLDFGSTYAVVANHGDVGAQAAGGLAASMAVGQAALSVSFELPLTLTVGNGAGGIAAPRGAVTIETPLFGDLSVGVEAGLGWRAAFGGAPGPDSRPLAGLLATATYRVF